MDNGKLSFQVASGLFWAFGERILAQGISFIVSIILARILLPEEYGAVSLLLIFINIANVFVSNGFGEALIRKKDASSDDYSTIFLCSLTVSFVVYLVLFLAAPVIGEFYNNDSLSWLIRIMAFKIPISAISTIQHAYVSNKMIFKKFFFATLAGTLISGILGIAMAYMGFGAWALVIQYLSNTCIDTLMLFLIVEWRPRLIFKKKSASELLGFGWKVMLSSLINTVYIELRSLIIGRMYTTADLAFYNKGNQFPSLVINNVNTAIGKVMFPAMSRVSEDIKDLKRAVQLSMKMTSYVVFPILAGLSIIAHPLITILLTSRWENCIIYLRISCVFWACQPMQTANWQALKVLGQGNLCILLEVVKKLIGIILIFVSMHISVTALAASSAIFGIVSMLINMIPNGKLIQYSIKEQIIDILPSCWLTIGMCLCIYPLKYFIISPLMLLLTQVLIGIFVYVLISKVSQNECYKILHCELTAYLQKKHIDKEV